MNAATPYPSMGTVERCSLKQLFATLFYDWGQLSFRLPKGRCLHSNGGTSG
jgi:hypothetical protein